MKAVFEKLLKRGDLTRDEAAGVMETIALGKAEAVQVSWALSAGVASAARSGKLTLLLRSP